MLSGGPLRPPIYVHALPWARGWSIFVSDNPSVGAYEWRAQPSRYKGLQHAIYAERGETGPENVPYTSIVSAVTELAYYIKRLADARRKRFAKAHWYWPRTVLENMENKHANASSEHQEP